MTDVKGPIDLEVVAEEIADDLNQAALDAGCFLSISSVGPVGMTPVTKTAFRPLTSLPMTVQFVDNPRLGLSNQEECALTRLSCRRHVLASATKIARLRKSLRLSGAELKLQIKEAARYVPYRWRAVWLKAARKASMS